MRIFSAIRLICLVFLIHSAVLAADIEGPVDHTIEPVLSSEWICYIQNGDLYIKRSGESSIEVRSSKEAKASILGPDLNVKEETVFISWIERGPEGSRLIFTSINNKDKRPSKPLELAAKTKATQAKIFTSEEGKLFVLEIYQGQKPEVFINLSSDRGKTFRRSPLDAEGIESLFNPSPVVIDDTLYIFFSGSKDEKKYLIVKAYTLSSLKLKDSALIKETGGISFIEAFRVKDRPAAIYKTARDNKYVLEAVIKDGKGWEVYSIKGAEGMDVARMDYHVWNDGRILIVFSGEERDKFKQRIYAAISGDEGKSWDVKRIDSKEFDNTLSWLPRMAVDGNKAAVVWEDSRDIRRGIRMKLSPDRGNTWLKRDISVSDNKFYTFRPRISSEDGNIYLAWHQYRTDEKRVAETVITKLDWNEAFRMAEEEEKLIPQEEKKGLLQDSVKKYWDGMIKKDLKTTYELHDPFYRARIPLDYYTSQRGPMVYHKYEMQDILIRGNEAIVKLSVNYEIPNFRIMGKETSMPPKDFPIEDTWLFIDGKWHRKFVDAMSEGSAIQY